jgi:hypothetical protein
MQMRVTPDGLQPRWKDLKKDWGLSSGWRLFYYAYPTRIFPNAAYGFDSLTGILEQDQFVGTEKNGASISAYCSA